MMNLIRGIVGVLAVLFACQSLASWASKSGKNNQVTLVNGGNLLADTDDDGIESDGHPTCARS